MVDGTSSLAKRLKISDLAIGLTIVAFGTSAPELVVNIISTLEGSTDLAIGNVIGSNIANILLILGISTLIAPLTVSQTTVWKEIPLSLLAILLIGAIGNDALIDNAIFSRLTRIDGIVLLGFFIIFLYYTLGIAKQKNIFKREVSIETKELSLSISILFLFGGLLGLIVGGNWVVNGAISIAQYFKLSETLVGLTIVAIGTSLPELATSAVAAYKGKADIAIGNVVGSNIFNVFWILGISSLIRPLPFNTLINFDVGVAISATLLLFLWMFVGKKHTLERWQGGVFVLSYVCYIVFLILRG